MWHRDSTQGRLRAAGATSYRFNGRREEARRLLYEPDGPKPTAEEASAIRGRLIRDAFVGSGALLGLFLMLDWLF